MKIGILALTGFLLTLLTLNNSDFDVKNGESIFNTGLNLKGEVVQDMDKSDMSGMVHSCSHCHGDMGEGKPNRKMGPTGSIKFKDLSDAGLHSVPYTEDLLKRFLDEEIMSDGTKAKTGVIWKMSDKDKNDLIEYLKTLK